MRNVHWCIIVFCEFQFGLVTTALDWVVVLIWGQICRTMKEDKALLFFFLMDSIANITQMSVEAHGLLVKIITERPLACTCNNEEGTITTCANSFHATPPFGYCNLLIVIIILYGKSMVPWLIDKEQLLPRNFIIFFSNVDVCDANPCLNGGLCNQKNSTSYSCICKQGYSGINCGIGKI